MLLTVRAMLMPMVILPNARGARRRKPRASTAATVAAAAAVAAAIPKAAPSTTAQATHVETLSLPASM